MCTIQTCSELYRYALIIGLSSISAGFIIGYASPATSRLDVIFVQSSTLVYQFASIMNIGALLGCLTINHVMDQYGRKGALKLTTVPCLCGWLVLLIGIYWSEGGFFVSNFLRMEPTTATRIILVTGRLLTGISCGAMMTVASVFLVEIAPTHLRGQLGASNQLGITVGIFFAYLFGLALKAFPLNFLNLVGATFPCALLFWLHLCPESPRWLLQVGRRTEAVAALKQLRFPISNVDEELKDYEDSLANDAGNSSAAFNWRELFRVPLFSTTWRIMALLLLQQLTGINAVMFYAEAIFLNAGVGIFAPYYVALLGLAQVIFTFGSVRVVDLYGRKLLLQWASVLMTIALFILGLLFRASPSHQILPIVCLVLFMLGFSLGWGPVPSLMAAELFPLRARSTAGGIAIGVSWISSFLVTSTFPHLVIALGPSIVFIIFSVACIMAGLYVVRFIPETKGRSLEDIQMNASVSKLLV